MKNILKKAIKKEVKPAPVKEKPKPKVAETYDCKHCGYSKADAGWCPNCGKQ